jgi:hypothetical protein
MFMAGDLSLGEQIDDLSPDQAQKAILNFYGQLPKDLWAGDQKWPTTDIEIRASVLQGMAPTEIQTLLSDLTIQGNEALKAAMAKALLIEFSQYEWALSHVESAVADARKPQMLPIPLFIGAFLIVLAIIPTKIEIDKTDGKEKINVEFGNLEQLAKLAESLKDIADKFDLWQYLK